MISTSIFAGDRAPMATGAPLRVLHVAQSIAGGVASFLDELAPYQSREWGAANIRFLVPEGSAHHLERVAPAQVATFPRTERSPGDLFDFGRHAVRLIDRFAPDIIHCHSTFAGAVVRLMRPRRPDGPRLVYCPHGWAFAMEVAPTLQAAYAAAERALAARADRIIVNSLAERDLALARGLPLAKVRTVRNGIAWADPVAPREPSATIHLAFIGRHDRQKGLDLLLDAIDRHEFPRLHFHLVGERVLAGGEDRTIDDRANVTRYGWLTREQVAVLLHKMDAVVMPSRWEAFGLVAIEAMRAGVPVIGSNRGALPEIIRDGRCGHVFDLDDPDALVRVLEGLSGERLRAMGMRARSRFEACYTARRMNRETLAVYDEALGQLRRPAAPRLVATSSRTDIAREREEAVDAA